VRVKICGIRDEAGLEAACAAGADAVGFVLAPSPRRVSLREARALLRLVPAGIERVAVFARATRAELAAALELDFDALQAELDSDWPPLPGDRFALAVLRDGPELEARALTLDPGQPRENSMRGALVLDGSEGGGRGAPVDAARARRVAALRPVVLAGGLTPANVCARIRAVRPLAVDVSSGVERVPAQKDPTLVHAFVRSVRALAEIEAEIAT
jgi:phosphoribosylanthranilate isomerase